MAPLLVLFAILLLFTALAAYADLRTGEIPNRLIAIGLLLALPIQSGMHYFATPNTGPGEALSTAVGYYGFGLILCGLAPLVLFYLGSMGGGDVKLLAMVGAFVGPFMGLEIEVYAFVFMALYAGARLAYQGQLLKLLGNSARLIVQPFLPKERRRAVPAELMTSLRFAPAVFAATLFLVVLHLTFGRAGLG
jgi:prepilin peptidase CpaA